jgi:hypothetical protein
LIYLDSLCVALTRLLVLSLASRFDLSWQFACCLNTTFSPFLGVKIWFILTVACCLNTTFLVLLPFR